MQSLNSKTREGSFKASSTQALDEVQLSLFDWQNQWPTQWGPPKTVDLIAGQS